MYVTKIFPCHCVCSYGSFISHIWHIVSLWEYTIIHLYFPIVECLCFFLLLLLHLSCFCSMLFFATVIGAAVIFWCLSFACMQKFLLEVEFLGPLECRYPTLDSNAKYFQKWFYQLTFLYTQWYIRKPNNSQVLRLL